MQPTKKINLALITVGIFILTFALTYRLFFSPNPRSSQVAVGKAEAADYPIRGQSYDLWADLELGKRDFAEIAAREIVAYKLNEPGGVTVDVSATDSAHPGKLYVWDSGNDRILGIDLATCYAQESPCPASVVIGQPQLNDYGACNLDSSFSSYPSRIPATAATLCGVSEKTHTTLEDKSFVTMHVDSQGNLYVPDSYNHRLLKYIDPFTTDTIADDVWGQPDFSGNGCNITGGIGDGFGDPPPPPTDSSLCFHSLGSAGAGVTFDSSGNMWVADGGNNRVLRFPKDPSTDTILKQADLVLGQPNFTTGGDWSYGSGLDRMHAPESLSFDNQGILYVVDSQNNRVLVFNPPFYSGMPAAATFGQANLSNPVSVEWDPQRNGIWIFDNEGWSGKLKLFNLDGTLRTDLPELGPTGLGQRGGGSIGIDGQGSILASTYVYGQNVHRVRQQSDGTFIKDKDLFSPPFGYNLTTARRFEHPGIVGVAVAANQVIATDNRLLFWNDPASLTNGKPPDGYVGAESFTQIPSPGFNQLKADQDNKIWVNKYNEVRVYQAPLTTGMAPLQVINSPLNVVGGGQLTFDQTNAITGLAPTEHGEYLWLSQTNLSRVFRVKDPLTNPVVDVILGQADLAGSVCNRGIVPPPSSGTTQTADLTMLCYPGLLSIDRLGNLYVSDHYLEAIGNLRLLMFAKSVFPDNLTQPLFAPPATKEFPRIMNSNPVANIRATFEPAFDSTNRMVVGYNAYLGPRFPDYYNDPTQLNPNNPSDPTFALPDGSLKDFYNGAVAATFDSDDNLYVFDANRGQLRIYRHPFPAAPTNTPSPTLTPSATPTPTPTVTVISLLPVADSYVRSDNPNRNYGLAPTLQILGGSKKRIGYMKFDLSTTAGKSIISGKLRLYVTDTTSSTLNIKQVANISWSEGTINYKNRPALGTTITAFTQPPVNSWVEIDITSEVVAKSGQTFSLGIDMTGTNTLIFDSKDHQTPSLRPLLVVEYR